MTHDRTKRAFASADTAEMVEPTTRRRHIVRQYFPRVQGNTFFDRIARPTRLRLLEQFYFRIGLITLDDLQRKYGGAP